MAISITRKKFINLGWSFEYLMLHSLGYNFCSVYVMVNYTCKIYKYNLPISKVKETLSFNDNVSLTLEIA